MAQFGGPNNISAARQFTQVYGQNAEAVRLMADHQLGRLKAEGIDPTTGLLREGAVEKFLTMNRERSTRCRRKFVPPSPLSATSIPFMAVSASSTSKHV